MRGWSRHADGGNASEGHLIGTARNVDKGDMEEDEQEEEIVLPFSVSPDKPVPRTCDVRLYRWRDLLAQADRAHRGHGHKRNETPTA